MQVVREGRGRVKEGYLTRAIMPEAHPWKRRYRWVRWALAGCRPRYKITKHDYDYWHRCFVIRERTVTCKWCGRDLGVETDGKMRYGG